MHCIGVFFLLVTSIKQLLLMCFCLLLSSILVPQTYISSDHYTCRYEEVCKYNFKNPKSEFDMATGHFTQVVWRDSLVLGVGKAMGKTFHGRPSLYFLLQDTSHQGTTMVASKKTYGVDTLIPATAAVKENCFDDLENNYTFSYGG